SWAWGKPSTRWVCGGMILGPPFSRGSRGGGCGAGSTPSRGGATRCSAATPQRRTRLKFSRGTDPPGRCLEEPTDGMSSAGSRAGLRCRDVAPGGRGRPAPTCVFTPCRPTSHRGTAMKLNDWQGMRAQWKAARGEADVGKHAVFGVNLGKAIDLIKEAAPAGVTAVRAAIKKLLDETKKYKDGMNTKDPDLVKWIKDNLSTSRFALGLGSPIRHVGIGCFDRISSQTPHRHRPPWGRRRRDRRAPFFQSGMGG